MRVFLQLVAIVIVPSFAVAQSGRPEGLRIRTDAGATDTVAHQRMPPGWHMTTGPAAILYDPGHQSRGRFAVEAEIFLFPGESNEGFGVFLGGTDLESANASWTAFLITKDGSATVERRQGGTTMTLFPPDKVRGREASHGRGDRAQHHPCPGAGRLRHLLGERATDHGAARTRASARRDLRVPGFGKGVNLHASNLDLVTRLAPFPARR